jgi:hypothetical protein
MVVEAEMSQPPTDSEPRHGADTAPDASGPLSLWYAGERQDRAGRIGAFVFLVGPFLLVGLLFIAEFTYVRFTGNGIASGRMSEPLRAAALVELVILVCSLINVLLMPAHLSHARAFKELEFIGKSVVCLFACAAYLAAVLGAAWFVAITHMV